MARAAPRLLRPHPEAVPRAPHYDGAVPPIETMGAIRARRVRAALHSEGWRIVMVGAALFGAVVGAFIGKHPGSQFVLAIGIAIVFVAIVARGHLVPRERARPRTTS